MASLGEVLAALHGPEPRFESVRATVVSWSHRERLMDAFRRGHEGTGGAMFMAAVGDGDSDPLPVEATETTRVAHAMPDRWRIERDDPPEWGAALSVHVGEKWWSYSQRRGSMTNASEVDVSSDVDPKFTTLLDPWQVCSALRFTSGEDVSFLGRPAVTVVATANPDSDDYPASWLLHGLGTGADAYRLAIDRERGVLLRVEAILDGEPFSTSEIVEISFNLELPEDTFVFSTPDERPLRSPSDLVRSEEGPLHALAGKLDWTAFAPTNLDPDWRLRASLTPPDAEGPQPGRLHLLYHSPAGPYSFSISQTKVGPFATGYNRADPAWTTIERDGVALHVLEHDQPMMNVAVVWLECDGTHIELQAQGGLPLDELVAVALDLKPAPTEPPHTITP